MTTTEPAPNPSAPAEPTEAEIAEATEHVAILFARRLKGETLTSDEESTLQTLFATLPPAAFDAATSRASAIAFPDKAPSAVEDRSQITEPSGTTDVARWRDVAEKAEMEPYRPLVLPNQHTWGHIVRMANDLGQAIALPDALRGRPADIALVLLAGHDVGIGATTALNKIHVINGRPTMASELMKALIIDRGHYMRRTAVTPTSVTVRYRRSDWPKDEFAEVEWTLEMAKKAELIVSYTDDGSVVPGRGKDVWKKFTRAMLTARAISEAARLDFPDVLCGVSYTPEEISEGVDLDEAGEPVKIQATFSTTKSSAPTPEEAAIARGWESIEVEKTAHKTISTRIRACSEEHRAIANKMREESGWPLSSKKAFDALVVLVEKWEGIDLTTDPDPEPSPGKAVPTHDGRRTETVEIPDLVQDGDSVLCANCHNVAEPEDPHHCTGGGCECPCTTTVALYPCPDCGAQDRDEPHAEGCPSRPF